PKKRKKLRAILTHGPISQHSEPCAASLVNHLVTQDSVSDWEATVWSVSHYFTHFFDCQRRVRFLLTLVRKQGVDIQGHQPALLATTAVEHSLRACASPPSQQHNR